MLFTPISPRIIYSVEVENPPTLSLCYRRVRRSDAKPCHNRSSSAHTGSIYPALSFSRSTLIPLDSASIRPLSFCPFFFTFHLPLFLSISHSAPSFHSFVFMFSLLLCWHGCVWLTWEMLAWCMTIYTEDDKLRLNAVILSYFCLM